MASETYAAKLSSFHTASQENNPFTVYVVTVRKDNQQWRVFRRFKEWEDLRDRLRGWCGTAPPMPGKVLFGRMRPEVIEARVLGLQQFLAMALASPQYMCPEFVDFLEREKNQPPVGLDVDVLEPHDTSSTDAGVGGGEGSIEGVRQAQLKQIVDAAALAFISVSRDLSQEAPQLDSAYLNERSQMYANMLRPAEGPPPGSTLSLSPPAAPDASAAPLPTSVEAAISRLLAEPPTNPSEASLVRATAAAVNGALGSIAVQGNHEVIVTVG